MQTNFTLDDGRIITINPNALGVGGEGSVYEITKPAELHNHVFKYFDDTRLTNTDKEARVSFMIANPPVQANTTLNKNTLIWPSNNVFDRGAFRGFIMPKANGILLESLCERQLGFYPPPRHNQPLGKEWESFARSNKLQLNQRLELCSKIAKAVKLLHSNNLYIAGDLKPVNIFVESNGDIHIVDLDSCQITKNDRVLFEAKMNTEEYSPPHDDIKKKTKEWDYFIIAIIFYRLLCAKHPFDVIYLHPYDMLATIKEVMQAGLFGFGKAQVYASNIRKWHGAFNKLTTTIQELFIRTLDDGLQEPAKRNSCHEWINALTEKPIIKIFEVAQLIIIQGQTIDLIWNTENASSAELEGFGQIPTSGKMQIKVIKETIFRITATNSFGSTSKSFAIAPSKTPEIKQIELPMPRFNINVSINLPSITLSAGTSNDTAEDACLVTTLPLLDIRKTFTNILKKIK
jgi:DNA-binding helix-hairpin-helix protein with protein kinase domain